MTNFGLTPENIYPYLVRAMVLFTMVPVHECAHGLMADRLGDDTPRMQGRLTLNPFAHLEWTGSIMMFLIGIGWGKPVSVDARNFKHPRRDMALTALAGPVSNLLMAFFIIVIYKLLPERLGQNSGLNIIRDMLLTICFINICLAVFNLIPIPPLDGSKIFGSVLPDKLYWGMMRYQRQITFVFMLLLILGVMRLPVNYISSYIFYFYDWLTSPIEWLLHP